MSGKNVLVRDSEMGNELKKDKMTKALAVILAALIVLTFFRFFYKLGDEVVQHTDEGWHGVNVYEMYESGNWIVPTQYHEVDYASKPPLNFWADLILFKLIGPSELALRLPSAISGFATYLILIVCLWKQRGLTAAVIFSAVFPALRECFRFHMFRTGDMDAMFGLFFVLTMIALHRIAEGDGKMLIWAALSASLAFLVKTSHVAVIILIGLLYLPMIYRELNVKRVLGAVIAFALPIVTWILLRYPYDGFAYFNAIVFGEASGKTASLFTPLFLTSVIREKVTWLMIAILFLRGCGYFLTRKENKPGRDFLAWCGHNYLTLLVILVPLVFYSVAGAEMAWYIYPSYYGITVLISTQASEVMKMIRAVMTGRMSDRIALLVQYIFLAGTIGICLLYTADQIQEYRNAGDAGFSLQQLRSDMKECVATHGDKVFGKTAYIASDRHRNYGDRGHWEQTFMFYGYTIGGFDCKEGGVEGFLADEDSLLVLDGELWEEYADVLTGYVFLEQNTYYILNHDRYY